MKKKTKRRSCIKRSKQTQKRRKQRGGNCGCGVVPIHGGNTLNPYILPLNAIPLNTFNNDPTTLMSSERITRGGRSRKYQRKQTPYYPRKKYIRGGDPLLGSAYNPISAFGTTSGIPFSSNTLFGISNQAPANGMADIPFFGNHNPPLV